MMVLSTDVSLENGETINRVTNVTLFLTFGIEEKL